MDRQIIPKIKAIHKLVATEVNVEKLKNGLQWYKIHEEESRICRLDVILGRGRPAEKHKLVAKAVGELVEKGTERFSRREIAELIDFTGTRLIKSHEPDASCFTFYFNPKYDIEILDLITEMIIRPKFTAVELISHIKRSKQKLEEDLTIPSFLAFREATEAIFGPHHPYGYNGDQVAMDELNVEMLIEYHQQEYSPQRCSLITSGAFDKEFEKRVREALNKWDCLNNNIELAVPTPQLASGTFEITLGNNDLQTAFCIIKPTPGRNHKDYYRLWLLSIILGGYFGSRLMKSIREKLGLVYDIQAFFDSFVYSGIFVISGECKRSASTRALKEISGELDTLTNVEIDNEEHEMVKNYIAGGLMSQLDGSFSRAERLRTILAEGTMPINPQEELENIRAITPRQILETAKLYLSPETFMAALVN